ncbi:putative permease [Actinoplanes missouriensis 431]|uniref:Putative permease n=1 Tax=Actinoplanes missouriensis (strain ATCC 14538 / DSM 43046 / CBS 188.64 / JCM 3121 / NBRC 102363 / NCIMB 12654 / NRRL B-3342 / UNCC 431) TaxID=512565 RepID=I0H562_ACTM4|nr:ABC transporter permease [Actinoplanes missouriensis]BAL88149.1 putative permease [Actinoplanes missouriensis 431]
MMRLSWAGFRDRWTLFAGATLTVCLGVALVQSSLLLLVTAATRTPPAGASPNARMRFAESNEALVALLAVSLGFAALLAVFIIASTFAFAVEQRRRELALLRVAGATRRHLRRLLLGEALLLGGLGTLAGIPAGVAATAVQTGLLHRLNLAPDGFTGHWQGWIVAVSAATGPLLAVTGVLLAARRAGRIRPLAALRDAEDVVSAVPVGRWALGLVLAVGALVLAGLAPVGGATGGQAMATSVSVCAVIALSLLGPALVRAMARLVPGRGAGVAGLLAVANLRDDARRAASVAAPLLVLTGLLLGQAGAASSFAAAGRAEQHRDTRADLVVEGAAGLPATPGVAATAAEAQLPVALTTGRGELAYTRITSALVVDASAYARVHPLAGDLSALRGAAVAAGPGADGFAPGDTVGIRVGDTDLGPLPVVAAVPQQIGGGATVLLPVGLLTADQLSDANWRSFVTLDPAADVRAVADALRTIGPVRTTDDWLRQDGTARSAASTGVLIAVMGLGVVYALVGVVNAIVITVAARRREFAAVRAAGFTRAQVIRIAITESALTTAIGLTLGAVAAGGTLLAVLLTTGAVSGAATLDLPWSLIAVVVVGGFMITGATSAVASFAATRDRPVAVLAARE